MHIPESNPGRGPCTFLISKESEKKRQAKEETRKSKEAKEAEANRVRIPRRSRRTRTLWLKFLLRFGYGGAIILGFELYPLAVKRGFKEV